MQTNNKLREALEYLRDASRDFCHLILNSKHNEVFDKYKYAEVAKIRDSIANANAALAAPARNCDVGTVDDWLARFSVFCERCSGSDCDHRLFKDEEVCDCFARWLQMPYAEKEGGNK